MVHKYNLEQQGGSHVAPKSKYKKVVKFFPVSIDDFFVNPDGIVRYAKSLPKNSDPDGTWPGKRTKELWEIDKELNDAIVLKILSCYYDMSYQDISWESSSLTFQEIPAFSKNKDDVRNRGWIHQDSMNHNSETMPEIAGLIYLTPDIDPDSGTSLFTLKQQNDNNFAIYQKQYAKHLMYREDETIDQAYYAKKIKDEEELFIEKTRFANIYNRMIMYDTNESHRANSYYNEDGKDVRSTLVFFIGGLNVDIYPLEKIRYRNTDEFIEYRCTLRDEQT